MITTARTNVKGGSFRQGANQRRDTSSEIGTRVKEVVKKSYKQVGKHRRELVEELVEVEELVAVSSGTKNEWVQDSTGKNRQVKVNYTERVITNRETGMVSKHIWKETVDAQGNVVGASQTYTKGSVLDMIDAGANSLVTYLETAGVSSEYSSWFLDAYGSMTGEQKGKFWSEYHKTYGYLTFPSTATYNDSIVSLIDDANVGGFVEAVNRSMQAVYGAEMPFDSIPDATTGEYY